MTGAELFAFAAGWACGVVGVLIGWHMAWRRDRG